MLVKKNVLAISGSTRKASINHRYIQAIGNLVSEYINITLYAGLTELPHFNPDLDMEEGPVPVTAFRNKIKESDGVLICTPEYAMGVPGSLKNALDWTVSSSDFNHKPVALITAGLSGLKAHDSLLDTLRVLLANIPEEAQMIIPFAKTKLNDANEITDAKTASQLQRLLSAFMEAMNKN